MVHLTGLAQGDYSVNVDGKDAGQFSAEALAAGLPVGRLSPKAINATEQLASLIRKRADLYFFRWRQLELPYGKEYKAAAPTLRAIDGLIDEMHDRTYAIGAFHKYEITIIRVK